MKTEPRYFFRYMLIAVCLVLVVSLPQCRKGNPVGLRDVVEGSNNIISGEFVKVATETIGAAGGTFTVNKPGDPVNGLKITVPANSYPTSKTFEISTTEIKSHQLGQYFHPISPLIKISNGGDYANDVMQLKVPVKVPKGYFAMGFFYDDKNGTVEGLPLLALDSTSVTVGTRHFSLSDLSAKSGVSLLKANDANSFSNVIISSISESVLQGMPLISTGYKLTEDNWEFVNRGPYIEPKGMCAGMSISSMWYYYEKHLRGAPYLYGEFDTIDKISEDNPHGIRFAATIQADLDWDTKIREIFVTLRSEPNYHYLSWRAFELTMLLTGEPQYVGLLGDVGGHAIVAYQVSPIDGKLYVADPNFPNQNRTITFSNNKFQPYSSQLDVSDVAQSSFTGIGYFSKTAMIDWAQISKRWSEFESSKIGTVPPNTFPEYQLWVINGGGFELADKLSTNLDTLIIEARCEKSELVYLSGTNAVEHAIFNDKGDLLAGTKKSGDKNLARKNNEVLHYQTINLLKPGLNKLGVAAFGMRSLSGGGWLPRFIDFRWIDVICQKLEIQSSETNGAPILAAGEVNKEYKLVAKTYGSAPSKAKYVWNFGDSTPEVTITTDSTVKHTFTAAGNYTMTVKLYDNATATLLRTAQARALIGGNLLALLQKCVMIDARFLSKVKYSDASTADADLEFINSQSKYGTPASLTWNGNNFTVKCSTKKESTSPGKFFLYNLTISGTVSLDGMMVASLSATEDVALDADPREKTHWLVEMKNVPFFANMTTGSSSIQLMYESQGAQIQPLVSKIEINESHAGPGSTTVATSYVSTTWSASSKVYVYFFSSFM